MDQIKQATLTRPPLFKEMPRTMPGLTRIVQQMLEKNMSSRLRAPKLLQDAWFQTVSATDASPRQTKSPPRLLKRLMWWRNDADMLARPVDAPAMDSDCPVTADGFFSSAINDSFFD